MGGNFFHKCKTILKRCDLFGTFITFRINDEIEYKSIVGGFSTIFFIILTVSYTFYYSINFIKRKNLDLIYSYKIVETQPYINLTESKFNLAFGVQRQIDGGDYIFENYDFFNYSIELIEWINENTFIYNHLHLKPCTTNDFYNTVNTTFNSLNLKTLLCPDIKHKNFSLDGLYSDIYFKYLRLNLSLSDYAINHLNELYNYLNTIPLEMVIYFIDTTIDYQKQYFFMTPYINYLYRGIDFSFIKYLHIFISPIEFITDDNLLFEKAKKELNSMLDSSYDYFSSIKRDKNDNDRNRLIGQILIKASPKIIQFKRHYQKLPSFIADLSGILEELLVIIILFVNIIERKLVDIKIINNITKFRGSKYYDIEYLFTVFHKDRIRDNVFKLIKSPNLNIEKKQNITSVNKKVIFLLNNYVNYTSKNGFQKKKKNYKIETNKISQNFTLPEYKNKNDKKLNKLSKRNSFNHLNFKKDTEIVSDSHSFSSINFPLNKMNKKLKNENFRILPLSFCEMFIARLCFYCSEKQRKRFNINQVAENKIHFYLNIFQYIIKMQEIDLLKYCLLNKEQINLFDFLAIPPISLGNNDNNSIYKEFENRQKKNKKYGIEEINELFKSYNIIRDKKEICFEDIKLLRLIRAEIDFLKE